MKIFFICLVFAGPAWAQTSGPRVKENIKQQALSQSSQPAGEKSEKPTQSPPVKADDRVRKR